MQTRIQLFQFARSTRWCSLFALIGVAHNATAFWGLRFDVSTDGGATWHDSVKAVPGQTVTFRFGSYFDESTFITTADGTGGPLALNRFTGQNRVQGLGVGDVIQNIVMKTTSSNAAVRAVTGNLIGTTGIVSFASNLYLGDTPLTFYNPIYTGQIVVSPTALPHAMTLLNNQFGSGATHGLTFYNSASPTNRQSGAPTDDPNHFDITASIDVVPSPSSLSVPFTAALIVARRRRL